MDLVFSLFLSVLGALCVSNSSGFPRMVRRSCVRSRRNVPIGASLDNIGDCDRFPDFLAH